MLAMESPRKRALKLQITCRSCREGFTWYLAPSREDVTITCPFCDAFLLIVIENFSADAPDEAAWPRHRRYRI